MMIASEILIKNIISEFVFDNKICESLENQEIVSYIYNELYEARLLYGEPVTVPELRKILHSKIVNFEFIKLNGEVRPAKGTTMMKYIPQSQHPKGIRPSSPKVATFFDLQKKDWRSVSQDSREIVLSKDEKTGKPVVMVKDKPEGKEIPAAKPMELAIGDVFQFSKSKQIKYQSGDKKQHKVPTWITITRTTDEGTWGVTAGSKLDILLTPERMERLGEPMEIGDEYQFAKLDKAGNRIYTTIKITRKTDEGFWGKTAEGSADILLSNDRLLRVHAYEQPDLTIDGEPADSTKPRPVLPTGGKEEEPEKPEVSKVKPIAKTEISKEYHFKNPVTGAIETEELTPKDVIKKLKKLGPNWILQTPEEYETGEKGIEKLAQTTTSEPPPEEELEEPEEAKHKPIIKKGQDLDNIDAGEL